MYHYQSHDFEPDPAVKGDCLTTDHTHRHSVTVHGSDFQANCGYSIEFRPAHIPVLLDAVRILLQYSDAAQQVAARETMSALILAMSKDAALEPALELEEVQE